MGIFSAVGNVLSKDANNASNQGAGFWNNVRKTGQEQYDRLTNDKITTKSGKTNKNSGSGKGVNNQPPKNPTIGLVTADTITPQAAAFDNFYGPNAITSEDYEVDATQAGSAEGKVTPVKGKGKKGKTEPKKVKISGEEGYWSMFNAWSLLKWRGTPFHEKSPALDYYNKPSLNPGEDLNAQLHRNPTATKIIEYTREKGGKAYQYDYADFALCKYYGKISNDYMLTLRRFPMPVEDDILHVKSLDAKGQPFEKVTPDMARAITWMSETATGNKLDEILKFKVSTKWNEVEAGIQEISGGGGGRGGALGAKIGGSSLLSSVYGAANGMNAVQTANAKSGFDATKGTYPNHVFGPINIIKKVAVRDKGLDFSNDIELTFHYNLRQLKGVNPRVAFLDLMANLLVLTYNNGNFWGGAVRYTGGSGAFNKPFGDINKIKSGDFGGFLSGLMSSALKGIGNIASDISQNGFMGSKLGNNIIGGSLMKMFNTPQGGEAVNAFLTGDPTGQYHLTVGNPLNPIAVIGNLYCESADFQFGGELSYDGFPTELTVKISLKHARPRDKGDIEMMFNGGRGRLYLTPKGGVDTNENVNVSAYGNKDMKNQANDILKKMANG